MKANFEEGEPPIRVSRLGKGEMKPGVKARELQIKTILVPLDFSRASIQALKYSIPIANEFGSAIHLVHVQPADDFTAIESAGGMMLSCADSIALMQDRLSEAMRGRGRFWPDNCHVVSGKPYVEICKLAGNDNCHVVSGKPYVEICKLAGRIEARLIVLPTRGLGRLKHVFLGSTAERVVRYASCPVLVPRGAQFKSITWNGSAGARFTLRKILVPVDFSDCSLAGVRYAARLAQRTGAILRLLHVVFPHSELVTLDRVTGDLTTIARAAKVDARRQMKKLMAMKFLEDVRVEVVIRTGGATAEICGETRRDDIDAVVISTHGRTGFKRAMIGSVAEHVVRYAESPVLIVPSRGCS